MALEEVCALRGLLVSTINGRYNVTVGTDVARGALHESMWRKCFGLSASCHVYIMVRCVNINHFAFASIWPCSFSHKNQ